MSKKHFEANIEQLRQKAETQIIRRQLALVQPQHGEELLHELIHELRVHQIELEMQNEALRQSQLALEESRDRYLNFYEFAPVGYLTLSHEGMIEEVNLTGARLLGMERNKLISSRFASFIAAADRDYWYRHFIYMLQNNSELVCELRLENSEGLCFPVQLVCLSLKKEGKATEARIILTDIRECKKK